MPLPAARVVLSTVLVWSGLTSVTFAQQLGDRTATASVEKSHAPAPRCSPASQTCLTVVALGYKEQLAESSTRSLPGRVFINGRYIGDAPLSHGLSAGDYQVRIEYLGQVLDERTVHLAPGSTERVEVRIPLALSAIDRAMLEERARTTDHAASDARRAWQRAEHEAALVDWRAARAAWVRDTAAPRARRRALGTWGWLSLGLGGAFAISSAVLFATAAAEDNRAATLSAEWDQELDENAREALTDQIALHQQKRDRMQTAAITLAGATGAAVTAGIVLLAVRPTLAPEPEKPTLEGAGLRVTPVAGVRGGGLRLDWAF